MGAILGEPVGEAGLSGGLTYQTTLVSGASLVFALCLQPIYGAFGQVRPQVAADLVWRDRVSDEFFRVCRQLALGVESEQPSIPPEPD